MWSGRAWALLHIPHKALAIRQWGQRRSIEQHSTAGKGARKPAAPNWARIFFVRWKGGGGGGGGLCHKGEVGMGQHNRPSSLLPHAAAVHTKALPDHLFGPLPCTRPHTRRGGPGPQGNGGPRPPRNWPPKCVPPSAKPPLLSLESLELHHRWVTLGDPEPLVLCYIFHISGGEHPPKGQSWGLPSVRRSSAGAEGAPRGRTEAALGQVLALREHCVCTRVHCAGRGWDTHQRIPVTSLGGGDSLKTL